MPLFLISTSNDNITSCNGQTGEKGQLLKIKPNIDPIWEDAYRIQMKAYINQGNRPLAIRTYRQCVKVLEQELGISRGKIGISCNCFSLSCWVKCDSFNAVIF